MSKVKPGYCPAVATMMSFIFVMDTIKVAKLISALYNGWPNISNVEKKLTPKL